MRRIQIFLEMGRSSWAVHISTWKFDRLLNFHDGIISISEIPKHDHEHPLSHISSFVVSSSPIHRSSSDQSEAVASPFRRRGYAFRRHGHLLLATHSPILFVPLVYSFYPIHGGAAPAAKGRLPVPSYPGRRSRPEHDRGDIGRRRQRRHRHRYPGVL